MEAGQWIGVWLLVLSGVLAASSWGALHKETHCSGFICPDFSGALSFILGCGAFVALLVGLHKVWLGPLLRKRRIAER